MTTFHFTNVRPVSPIPSPHSIPTKVDLRGSNLTSVANTTFPFRPSILLLFQFVKKSPPHIDSSGACPPLAIHRPDLPPLFKHDPLHHSMAWTGQYESYVTRLTTILTAVLFRARPFIQGEPFPSRHNVTTNDMTCGLTLSLFTTVSFIRL